MSTENNILQFPKNAIVRDQSSHRNEQLEALKAKSIANYADALISDITEEVIYALDSSGIDVETLNFQKDFIFFQSILSATIYRSLNLKHDLQSFIDESVSIVDASEIENEVPPGATS